MTQARTVLRSAAGLLLVWALVSGCDKENGYTLKFSHNLHVKDSGMACGDCHGKIKDGNFSGLTHAECKECHGDWVETTTIAATTCGKCHLKNLKELGPVTSSNAPTVPAISLFVHTAATSNRCADCHGAFLAKGLDYVPEMTRKVNVGIREQAHRWGLECSACHTDLDRRTPPPSHRGNWKKLHGPLGTQPDNACTVCHTPDSCRECHETEKPRTHNTMWRLKTHGSQAAFDRERCLVCHQQDSCVACHEETRPRTHNASWRRNHCYSCHEGPAVQNSCAACHEGGNILSQHQANRSSLHDRFSNNCSDCHYPGSPID
jgi:hypothetical protein